MKMKQPSLTQYMFLVWTVAGVDAVLEPCSEPSNAVLPFCNTSLTFLDRAMDFVSRLSREEKIGQMVNNAPSIDKFHVDAYNWWTESLHGVLGECTPDGRCPTNYPEPIGIGATFNRELIKLMASQISSEARRMHAENDLHADQKWHWIGLDFWAPNINVFRDPRWGRGMETPGEDPYLNGEYAIMYIKGMQEGADSRYLKTVATLKHYTAYSLENWSGNSRHSFNANVSDQDLVQTYLPAFEAGIKQGRAKSVMCSYNAVNGVPTCASPLLLQEILREEWHWDGYVVSDCGAISDVFNGHKFKTTAAQAASASLKAGTDLDCGSFYSHLNESIQEGLVSDEDLDKALVRLFNARFELGMFDPFDQQPYMHYPSDTVGHADHIRTSLRIARESIVLLKNDNDYLPLDANSIRKIAALGPHFNSTSALHGNYYGAFSLTVSPLAGLKHSFSGEVIVEPGCDMTKNDTSGFKDAVKAASSADVAILFMGISPSIENEGNDRVQIGLPGVQEGFLRAISKVQKKTVLVLINGGSVDVSAAKENPNVVAIVEAFYPGMMGGQAIADVLFGVYNPSGRLPYTMHKKEFVDHISMADMSMTNYPGRTYRFFKGEVVYPFGFGLSYTVFQYKTEEIQTEENRVTYRVLVTNTGKRDGDVSVLAFLSFKGTTSEFSCPQSQLFDFEKIHLVSGQSKEIIFSASPLSLRCYRTGSKRLGSPMGTYLVRIGDQLHEFQSTFHGVTLSKKL